MKLILQVIKALFRKIEASRTHWDTRQIVTKEYTFDGNIDVKETIQINEDRILVKISDTFPEVSSITSLSVAATNISDGYVQEFELSPTEDIEMIADGIYEIYDFALYAHNGGEREGVYIPSGLYFSYFIDDSYTSKLSVAYNDGELKKLDKKYLPDEVIESIGIANNAQTTANNAQTTANSKMNANNPVGTGSFSMGRKANSVVGSNSHAEGFRTTASGNYSHAEGVGTTASGINSHAEGSDTTASGINSHAEGSDTTASGDYSHAEGFRTTASGNNSHAEGSSKNKFSYVVTKVDPTNGDIISAWNSKKFSLAKGSSSHVEGTDNLALSDESHAEGKNTTASGLNSHAEGIATTASGNYSHAEGLSTTASGNCSHAEGISTTASGICSHTEGLCTTASGDYSHAVGFYTRANSSNQHVQGKYNVEDSQNKYAHIVGNGVSSENRSNAHTLDWKGVPWFQGRPQFGGTAMDNGSQTVMANGDKEIILTSSTAGSTKKFKITVDDSGTISATEVTT